MAKQLISSGVNLTIQFLTGGDRSAVVVPLLEVGGVGITFGNLCRKCIDDFKLMMMTDLLGFLVDETSVMGLQADGMLNGRTPYREIYDATSFQGTLTGVPLPPSSGVITNFYGDPADFPTGSRTRVSRNTYCCIPEGDVSGKILDAGVQAPAEAYASALVTGFTSFFGGIWIRGMKQVSNNTDFETPLAASSQVRSVVGSMRRRLYPLV